MPSSAAATRSTRTGTLADSLKVGTTTVRMGDGRTPSGDCRMWEMFSARSVATRVDAQVRSKPLSATGFGNPPFRSLPIRSTVPRLDPDMAASSQATRTSLPLSRRNLKSATYRNITLAVGARSISIRCAIQGGSPGADDQDERKVRAVPRGGRMLNLRKGAKAAGVPLTRGRVALGLQAAWTHKSTAAISRRCLSMESAKKSSARKGFVSLSGP
jgi:hypothetical protein